MIKAWKLIFATNVLELFVVFIVAFNVQVEVWFIKHDIYGKIF